MLGLAASDAAVAVETGPGHADPNRSGGIVYRVTRPGTPPSFIVGTVHMRDDRLKLPRSVEDALGEVRLVLLELDPKQADGSSAKRLAKDLAEPDPARRAKGVLSPEAFGALSRWVKERGLSSRILDSKLSALVLILDGLESGERDAAPGLDAQLAELAIHRSIPTGGLETVSDAVKTLDDVPQPVLAEVLARMTTARGEQARMRERTVQFYLAADDAGLHAWMHEAGYLSETPSLGLPGPFLEAMLDRRTLHFAARAWPELERGGVMVAVGAAHLPGRQGLIDVLRRAGFTVDRVEP